MWYKVEQNTTHGIVFK